MKRTLTALQVFLLSFTLLNAQNDNAKYLFGINTGVSVPFAEFGTASMKPYAGYAGPGFNMEIDFMRYIGRFFGFTSNIGYASLFFREKAYQDQYDRILADVGTNSVSAGNYHITKGTVGFIFKIPVANHIEALMLMQLGVARSVHPDLQVTNSELGVINSVNKTRDSSPVRNIGIKLNYWLTDKYSISLNYGLNYTRPCFSDETSLEKIFFLPIRYMNINAGFVMKL